MKRKNVLSLLIISTFIFNACGRNLKRMEEGEAHFQASKRLYSKGENIQAMSEAENAAQADNKNEEVQNFLGLLYAERGDQEKAMVHFNKAIRLKPDYSEARNNLCAFLLQANRLDEALEHCKKAVENVTYATPERAYNNLGMIYDKKGDSAMAAQMHQKAILHNKKFVFSLLYLGKTSYEKKDFAKAKEYLQSADEACLASPKGSWGISCPESQYRLALTHLQLKQTQEAVHAFQNCLASDANGEFKNKCEKSLQVYR